MLALSVLSPGAPISAQVIIYHLLTPARSIRSAPGNAHLTRQLDGLVAFLGAPFSPREDPQYRTGDELMSRAHSNEDAFNIDSIDLAVLALLATIAIVNALVLTLLG